MTVRELCAEVRRLSASDSDLALRAITRLKPGDPGRTLTVDAMERFLRKPENILIAATVQETPVGFCLEYLFDRVDLSGPMVFFYEIGVAQEHRRRGIGRAMVQSLQSICREQRAVKMWVHTNRSNRPAMELYRSTGGVSDSGDGEVTFTYDASSLAVSPA